MAPNEAAARNMAELLCRAAERGTRGAAEALPANECYGGTMIVISVVPHKNGTVEVAVSNCDDEDTVNTILLKIALSGLGKRAQNEGEILQ